MSLDAHALQADRIVKRYGTTLALDSVSLGIGRGRFVTLLGPSGSGKTTLLMVIAGFVRPDSGRLLLDGRPIEHLAPEARNFGMVFQGYALFPHLSVGENVAFPLRVRGTGRAEVTRRVQAALDLVQLPGLADRMPRQLSGGQQQRVALARALVFNPDLLLLDEPLSALDKNLRLALQDELKALHGRLGLTFVYVTHDQQEALSLSDEVAILNQGRVVQAGPPAELYERPGSRFVAGFLGRSNFWSGSVEQVDTTGFTWRIGPHVFRQAGPAPDGPVLIALRPEKLTPARGEPADNRLAGVVTGRTYLGESWLVTLAVDGVGPVQALLQSDAAGRLQMGETLTLAWSAGAGVVISDG